MEKQNKYSTLLMRKKRRQDGERAANSINKHIILVSLIATTTTKVEPFAILPPQTVAIIMNIF